jgi:hypothetical protein
MIEIALAVVSIFVELPDGSTLEIVEDRVASVSHRC